MNEPIFSITPTVLRLSMQISARLGEIKAIQPAQISPKLRRENRIKTIHYSLAIENNSLSLDQVTAILDGKRVLGDPMEIKEVQNAADAYALMFQLDPLKVDNLLKAHGLLTKDISKQSGRFRSDNVGIFNGDKLIHAGSPPQFVPQLVADLMQWYRQSGLPVLVKSAVFHYELEFIHPFDDGNGRMGRMWHTLLMGTWNPIFYWLPVEEIIKDKQAQYYAVLNECDRTGESTKFIELMLSLIEESLNRLEIK